MCTAGANELILHPHSSQVVEVCAEIMRTAQCPRQDCLLMAATEVIAQLTADGVCLSAKAEALDLMTTVASLLNDYEFLPARSIGHLIEITAGLSSGVRTPYMNLHIEQIREPLTRIGRIFPELFGEKVRETNWIMSKLGISTREMTGNPEKYFGISKSLGALGAMLPVSPIARAVVATGMEHTIQRIDSEYLFFPSLNINDTATTETNDCSISASQTRLPQSNVGTGKPASSVEHANRLDCSIHRPGTYNYCGPSSCGSLAFPDGPCHHGTALPDSVGLSPYSEGMMKNLPKFDGISNKLMKTGEYIPPSQQTQAKRRIMNFVDLYYSSHPGREPPAVRSSDVNAVGPADQPEKLPVLAETPAVKSVSGGVNGRLEKVVRGKKALFRVSVDEIPELLMTKPLRK
jgi:hypothetical protein